MAKPIESLQRGLEVLSALTEGPSWHPLQALHTHTQIPKPTLLAILETLREEGVATKGAQGWALTNTWLMGINAYTLHRLHLTKQANTHKEKTDERDQSSDTQDEGQKPGGNLQAANGECDTHKSEGG